MKNLRYIALFCIVFVLTVFTGSAQETEERVIDQVVAQVNEGVITLSRVKREMKSIVEIEMQQGKTREAAQKLVDEKQGELIANMINEELLVQRAKEIGLDSEIENAINQRFVEIMRENNVKTIEELYEQMRSQNVDPQDIRDMWRKQIIRDRVIQREVQAATYWKPTPTQVKEYYEKHKTKFTKPETVSISELFLGFAGRDEAAVREKAKELVAQIRTGSNWDEVVKANSDPGVVTRGSGKAEQLKVLELVDTIKTPLQGVKVGGITEPIEAQELGMIILRVDARDAASNESTFDEEAVRMAMLQENFPAAQKEFYTKLREEAYIKINDTYRPMVSPILFADERKDATVSEK